MQKRRGLVITSALLIGCACLLVILAISLSGQTGRPATYKSVAWQENYTQPNLSKKPTIRPSSQTAPTLGPLLNEPLPGAELGITDESSLQAYSGEALQQILSGQALKPSPGSFARLQVNSLDLRYNPIAEPTITFQVFERVLAEGHSPALPEAAAMYEVCLREHCDPALALAFFDKESSLGTKGIAVETKSLGNIRCKANVPCYTTAGNGSFQVYPSWTAGLTAWAVLLRDTYLGKWKLATVEQILPRYAPGEQAIGYISAVRVKVDNLRLKGHLR
ncbi:MAG: glucosaminidase domain-containing protein [Chloroflexi bacterium]|nr:glucosaminidase domain-containing protein [Chloroflexota bacterium]